MTEEAMSYQPKPVEMDPTIVTPEFKAMVEEISEGVHDAWAAERIGQGWTFGPQRNDEKKEHPSLKPYDELPEAEKEVDRAVVRTCISAILNLGYKLTK
jgi:hypothetical protein